MVVDGIHADTVMECVERIGVLLAGDSSNTLMKLKEALGHVDGAARLVVRRRKHAAAAGGEVTPVELSALTEEVVDRIGAVLDLLG